MQLIFARAFVLLVCVLIVDAAPAQQAQSPLDNVELRKARELLKVGREEIVREEMRFTEQEAAGFWPLYEEYEEDLLQVRDRYAELLAGFTAAHRAGTVSAEQAIRLVEEYLSVQEQVLRIRQRYFGKFRNVLPPRKAARFYQLENKMEVEMEYELAQYIPLVDPV